MAAAPPHGAMGNTRPTPSGAWRRTACPSCWRLATGAAGTIGAGALPTTRGDACAHPDQYLADGAGVASHDGRACHPRIPLGLVGSALFVPRGPDRPSAHVRP